MSDRPPWWVWPNLLALDAPLVAVVWQRFLAAAVGLALPAAPSVCLGLVVWGVYLLDRGLDARPGRPAESADRHTFARRHRSALTAGGGVCLLTGAAVAFTCLPVTSLIDGAAVGVALAGYLAVVHFTRRGLAGGKEVAVGLVFAGGVGVPLAARVPHGAAVWGPAVGGFAAVCVMNCLLIDRWEHARIGFGRWATAAAVVGLVAAAASPPAVAVALAAAVGLLVGLHLARNRVGRRVARVLADATLLTPLLVWPT